MKSVEVKYFAQFRELAGVERETLSVDCSNCSELYSMLKEKHKFSLPQSMIQLAINDEFSDFATPLKDGAKIVFIPPVSGG